MSEQHVNEQLRPALKAIQTFIDELSYAEGSIEHYPKIEDDLEELQGQLDDAQASLKSLKETHT